MGLDCSTAKKREAQFLATAVVRSERARGQDRPAPCRARVWRHDSILPLRTARRRAGRARDPGSLRAIARADEHAAWRGAIRDDRRTTTRFRLALPIAESAAGARSRVRHHTVADALSAGFAAGGDGLERAPGVAASTQNRPRLVRPAVARQRSQPIHEAQL